MNLYFCLLEIKRYGKVNSWKELSYLVSVKSPLQSSSETNRVESDGEIGTESRKNGNCTRTSVVDDENCDTQLHTDLLRKPFNYHTGENTVLERVCTVCASLCSCVSRLRGGRENLLWKPPVPVEGCFLVPDIKRSYGAPDFPSERVVDGHTISAINNRRVGKSSVCARV